MECILYCNQQRITVTMIMLGTGGIVSTSRTFFCCIVCCRQMLAFCIIGIKCMYLVREMAVNQVFNEPVILI